MKATVASNLHGWVWPSVCASCGHGYGAGGSFPTNIAVADAAAPNEFTGAHPKAALEKAVRTAVVPGAGSPGREGAASENATAMTVAGGREAGAEAAAAVSGGSSAPVQLLATIMSESGNASESGIVGAASGAGLAGKASVQAGHAAADTTRIEVVSNHKAASQPAAAAGPRMQPIIPIVGNLTGAAIKALAAPQSGKPTSTGNRFSGQVFAAAGVPVETQTPGSPVGPSDAQKQAYVDAKFGLMLHYGLNTFLSIAGSQRGGLGQAIYTGEHGSNTQRPKPTAESKWDQFLFPSSGFSAPYATQAEVKRNITDVWAMRAKAAGMKSIAFTAKHHFGWCAWDSAHTTYDIATSATPNVDLVQALIDSAREFGLKVSLYYSIPDRVHFHRGADGSMTNNNDEYFEFAKKQMKELLAYDPNGDLVTSIWYDAASHWDDVDFERTEDLRDYVRSLNPNVVQIFNQQSRIADIYNVDENTESIVPGAPGEYNVNLYDLSQSGTFYGWWSYHNRNDRNVRADLNTASKLVGDVRTKNFLNQLHVLNIPPGPNGLFTRTADTLLKQVGEIFNGGGRIDNFDLGWVYSGNWSSRINPSSTRHWQKTVHSTRTAGAYAEYKFFGKSVKLHVLPSRHTGDMDIYIDGVFQANFNSRPAARASSSSVLAYSTDSLADGEHTIRVVVGNSGWVDIDYIEVSPRVLRVALASAGADGVYATGDNVDVDVFFSGEVKVTGRPQVELEVGGSVKMATYVSGSGSRLLKFRYVATGSDADADGVSIGTNNLILNGGIIQVDDNGSARTTDADLRHGQVRANALNRVNAAVANVLTAGNDRLVGHGYNNYQLGMKTGFDEAYEGYTRDYVSGENLRASGDAGDLIRLDTGISTSDVVLMRDQNNVWVQVLGKAGEDGNRPVVASMKLVNYYENEQSKIERIVFADGTEWGHAQLHRIVMHGGSGDDSLYGRDDLDDIFDGNAGGNDRLLGQGGNDEYRLGLKTGFDEIYEGYARVSSSGYYLKWGGSGSHWSMRQSREHVSSEDLRESGDTGDLIRLDAGIGASDVVLVRDRKHVWVQVLGEEDQGGVRSVVASLKVYNYYANDQSKIERIVFADGNEWSGGLLVGSSAADTLEGSGADETYYGGGGADTYKFGKGFGQDTVAGDAGQGKAVFSGHNTDQLRFARDGNDLLVSVSEDSSRVRFADWLAPGGSRTIEAGAGSSRSLEVAKIIQALSVIQSDGVDKPQSIAIAEEKWTPIAAS